FGVRPRPRHRRDHREPLAARLRLPVQLALRFLLGRERGDSLPAGAPAVRPDGDRKRRLCGLRVHRRRHRPGLPRRRGDPAPTGLIPLAAHAEPVAAGEAGGHTFARVLGRADLLLFSVSASLTTATLASAASVGVSWFSWWAITMLLFFVPYGLMTAELGAAWPGEGGIYIWVREAMGARAGSIAAWFYWINNAYWTASVYMAFGATFHAIFVKGRVGARLAEGPGATWLQASIAILLTWLTVAVGVVRLDVSKGLPNVGAVVKASIFLSLGVLGLAALVSGRPSANAFTLAGLVPRWSDSLAFLPVLLYNAMGFELMSAAGDEMKDPQRDVPRVTLLTGLVIAVVYPLGILGILLAIPLEKLSLATGTWDALEVLGRQWGTAGDTLVLLV